MQVPVINDDLWEALFPSKEQSRIIVVQAGTCARNYVNLRDAAAWILSGIPWFTVLEQLMMIAI